ncbi:YopR family T3SS polymerization control protein [Aeromonas sp. R6-2]|uniref:YopR family T3SS polymerization control protein n=1 Tax=unclassified Aeromonas TaxID=257493 RepID=UPI0034A2FAAE
MMIPPLTPPTAPLGEQERAGKAVPAPPPAPVVSDQAGEDVREAKWQRYHASDPPDKGLLAELVAPVKEAILARFGQRTGPVIPAIDLPELRGLLREFDPLGKRRETVLLEVLAATTKGEGGAHMAELLRRELMTLLPRNAMVDNLLRNSHAIDLEG